jgi:hypothetical protein
MFRPWTIVVTWTLLPAVTHADADRLMLEAFPKGMYGLTFGESVVSAKAKCRGFTLGKNKTIARCVATTGEALILGFSERGRLNNITRSISLAAYGQCRREVREVLGAKGRQTYQGVEYWGLVFPDDTGKSIGGITCSKRFKGCNTAPSSCTPTLSYAAY